MAKSLSILYVTSEVYPFAKISSLSDLAYSYTLAMRDVGHDMRIMLPKFGNVSERKNRIHEINRLRDLPIQVGDATELATVKSSSMANPRTKVQAYITTNSTYFDQLKAAYINPADGFPFNNNDERFIFFSKTVIETCLVLGWVPDIIHCIDWQAALVVSYVKHLFAHKFKKTKLIFTINDFSEQGVYPAGTFLKTGFQKGNKQDFIFKNNFNFMKSAIVNADYITTVSPAYAKEILQDSDYSNGLNKLLVERKDRFSGISCGIDQWVWRPSVDNDIPHKYENDFGTYKYQNKKELFKRLGIPILEDAPTVCLMNYLAENSGQTILMESIEKLLKENVQFVVPANINKEFDMKVRKLAKKFPEKLAYIDEVDDAFIHLAYAGSDITIIPGLYEPSGINAMTALSYGVIPIARLTGAHTEILNPFTKDTKNANSFVFEKYDAGELIKTFKTALTLYQNRNKWEELAISAISGDYSWEKPAKKYDEIYKALVKSEI